MTPIALNHHLTLFFISYFIAHTRQGSSWYHRQRCHDIDPIGQARVDVVRTSLSPVVPNSSTFSIFLSIRFPSVRLLLPLISPLMTSSSLELEQLVELIENIFVDAYPTHRWPSTRMSKTHRSISRQGLDGVLRFVVNSKHTRCEKLTQTGRVSRGIEPEW